MRMVIQTISIGMLGLTLSASLYARQVAFDKQSLAKEIEYRHKFITRSGKPVSLQFALNAHAVNQSKRRFTAQSREQLSSRIKQQSSEIFNSLQEDYLDQAREEFDRYINQQAKRLPAGIRITNEDQGRNLRVNSDGSIPRARAERLIDRFLQTMRDKWESLNESYLDKFEDDVYVILRKHYSEKYKESQFVATFEKNEKLSYLLRVDFASVARQQTRSVRSIASAIRRNTQGQPMRNRISYALNFMQSIPYDTLRSRNATGQIGFVEPLTLFDINRGDCDTKSTAMAAILRNLYPDLKMIMVLVPNHAFLAVAIPQRKGDNFVRYRGVNYVVLEAAGPALTPVGKAYPTTLGYIRANQKEIKSILPII